MKNKKLKTNLIYITIIFLMGFVLGCFIGNIYFKILEESNWTTCNINKISYNYNTNEWLRSGILRESIMVPIELNITPIVLEGENFECIYESYPILVKLYTKKTKITKIK